MTNPTLHQCQELNAAMDDLPMDELNADQLLFLKELILNALERIAMEEQRN